MTCEQLVVLSAPTPVGLHGKLVNLLQPHGLTLYANPNGQDILPDSELAEALRDAVGLIVGPGRVDQSLIENSKQLRAISKFGVGTENIDLQAATVRGIPVSNTPDVNAKAVADLTIGLVLSLARSIPQVDAAVRTGDASRRVGLELDGATLGIVGLGSIGKEVAVRARAFGMRVVARSPTRAREFARENDVELLGFNELLSSSDYLTLSVPLNSSTRDLIGGEEMEAMPRGSYIINAARGGIVDESALASSLLSGHLAGAGLDVFADEPVDKNHPLLSIENVVVTPHIGGATVQSFRRAGVQAVENLLTMLSGESPESILNPEVFKER